MFYFYKVTFIHKLERNKILLDNKERNQSCQKKELLLLAGEQPAMSL